MEKIIMIRYTILLKNKNTGAKIEKNVIACSQQDAVAKGIRQANKYSKETKESYKVMWVEEERRMEF